MTTDDALLFADEDHEAPSLKSSSGERPWKVLIADDEEEVHRVTRMVLGDIEFQGRGLELISVYSAEEAIAYLRKEPEVALILLDVVMETDHAGLDAARVIREELENDFVRIVLRTGQPGQAPEETVILDYDINDYKAKTELTAKKLFTTVITSLRSFRDMMTIDQNKQGLRRVIEATPGLFRNQSMSEFTSGVLQQLTSLLSLGKNSLFCHGFAAACDHGELFVQAATGDYEAWVGRRLSEVAPDGVARLLVQALTQRKGIVEREHYVGYLAGKGDSDYVIYINGWRDLKRYDRDLIQIFFNNASAAHDNHLLHREIEETQSEVIIMLGEIAEARSQETGNHVKRVARYSELIALKVGVSVDEARLLRLVSPMHDIGKLGVPDAILNKPGRLDSDEWETMKGHAAIGENILRHSERPLMQAAALVAGQHHEKWDGSGYPRGLTEDHIHLFGRITAIADVFDALTVRRVYKEAWSCERVISYFQEQSGRHFDPALVRVLLDHLDEFMHIRDSLTTAWERGEVPRESQTADAN